ncbi:MAG: DNA polymerase III subunit gamma/tau [Prevotellaceae bacterium]|jgi:DNA polymerase-3 subunit gamma/tau|nr:DNA polymerase III subunit gamma/tau [Prevotellaceae bacterium]
MENYIVSARKYRPATFRSVVGQKALTTTLKNAIATGKLAHAYLFCGPRGVGKTTCARIFAKTINCLTPTENGEACNQCESCCAFNEQRSYNINELDAASNNSVDDIRQLVEQVRVPPQIGKYKVYIIDEVHMLTASAFNAFLKTLEEPPHHAIFILATTEKHKIIPTILSRCQIYDFNRISTEDIIEHLQYVAAQEKVQAETEALNIIALKADGGMRDALSIFDQVVSFTNGNITYQGVIENLNVLDYDYYFRLTDILLAGRVGDALLLFNDVLSRGFEGSHFISGLTAHFRDLLVSKDVATLSLLEVGASIRECYRVQAAHCPTKFLYQAMKLCNDCDLNYRASKNKRLLVELTLIQTAQLEEVDDDEHGRSPQPELRPIFNTPSAQTQTSASAQEVAPTVATVPVTHAMPVPPTTPKATPSRVESISLKNLRNKSKEEPPVEQVPTANETISTDENDTQAFDEQSLNVQWQLFASQLPAEHNALRTRMAGMRVQLLDDAMTIEVLVDNELASGVFAGVQANIESFLRRELRNKNISMKVRIAPAEIKRIAVTPTERYAAMIEKNPALQELRETFGLELN